MGQIVGQLASSLGRRDEKPNIELAVELANSGDENAIAELVDLTQTDEKPIRHDAIKVLYEIGVRQPNLLAPHAPELLDLLTTRDNRMIWGTLQGLEALAETVPELLAANLNAILDAADRSSVIAKDKTMSILAKLNSNDRFVETVTPVLLQRLTYAAANQFPMYAEMAASTISDGHRADLIGIIKTRRTTISFPAKQRRLDKLLRQLDKQID